MFLDAFINVHSNNNAPKKSVRFHSQVRVRVFYVENITKTTGRISQINQDRIPDRPLNFLYVRKRVIVQDDDEDEDDTKQENGEDELFVYDDDESKP